MAKKGQRNFIITISLVIFLVFATIQWILPSVISGVGLVNSVLKPSKKVAQTNYDSLAPPVLNIPFEATNSAQINIVGYATPNSKVNLYIDDSLEDTTESKEDGSFEFFNVELNLGTNNIYGKTVNEKGVESLPSKTLAVFYDNGKPSLVISEPEDGKTIEGGDKKITIKGKVDKDVKVYINNVQVITNLEGGFVSEQPLNEGENIFIIKALDKTTNQTEITRKVIFKP